MVSRILFRIVPFAVANLPALALASSLTVLDGDTFVLDGEHIRIANIDAPETRDAKCDAELRLGHVAKRRLEELLASAPPVITRGDPADGRMRDRRGRTLATISIAGRDVGEILISEELARPWKGSRKAWCNAAD